MERKPVVPPRQRQPAPIRPGSPQALAHSNSNSNIASITSQEIPTMSLQEKFKQPLPKPPSQQVKQEQKPLPPPTHPHVNKLRLQENFSPSENYQKLCQLVIDLLGPDEMTRYRLEEAIFGSKSFDTLAKSNKVTPRQEHLLHQFIRSTELTYNHISQNGH